jgi:hypothetical protein
MPGAIGTCRMLNTTATFEELKQPRTRMAPGAAEQRARVNAAINDALA